MDWIAVLTDATDDFAAVLAEGDLDAAVPTCPRWTLRDLADHLGGVHQWARHAVVEGDAKGVATSPPQDRAGVVAWYADSARGLVDTLAATPVDAPAWAFGPEPKVAGFWRRRQVHETVMHTYDALAALGREGDWRISPALAWDGIDEVATMFYPRQVRLGRTEPLAGTLRITPSDPELADVVPLRIGDADPVVDLRARASVLLRALWHRAPVDDPAAAALVATAITP